MQKIKEYVVTTAFDDDQIDQTELISNIKDGKVHFGLDDSNDSGSTKQAHLVREV